MKTNYISSINDNKFSSERPEGFNIDKIIITYSVCEGDPYKAIKTLHNNGASVHYTIKPEIGKFDQDGNQIGTFKDGFIDQYVSESQLAFYAGPSAWKNQTSLNANSIGIMLINDAKSPFSDGQINSLISLIKDINFRHGKEMEIIGLGETNTRHIAPGNLFPWDKLAESGIGKQIDIPADISRECTIKLGDSGEHITALQTKLISHGYAHNLAVTGIYDAATGHYAKNFANRYAPLTIDERNAEDNFVEPKYSCWNDANEYALNQLLGISSDTHSEL